MVEITTIIERHLFLDIMERMEFQNWIRDEFVKARMEMKKQAMDNCLLLFESRKNEQAGKEREFGEALSDMRLKEELKRAEMIRIDELNGEKPAKKRKS